LPATMAGVHLTGNGGLEKLVYREDIPRPDPGPGELLIKVRAAGVNNTDVNTRIGWYSKSVLASTEEGGAGGFGDDVSADASWSGKPLNFPLVQGADCYGEVVALGEGVPGERLGEKVLVRTMLRAPLNFQPFQYETFGSEIDGGFAQYAVAPAGDTFKVDADLSDAELGAVPCAYSTAEGMLLRGGVSGEDRVLILGASGGVGGAAVQLAKLRSAEVVAVAADAKAGAVREMGADRVLDRNADIKAELGEESVTAVIDLVGGGGFPALLDVLKRGGRYVTSGAIGGPIVELDLRTLYLKELSLLGSTAQALETFPNLIRYLEEGRLKPRIAATYPLSEIRQAQERFLAKDFVGKLVLIPPQD